MYKLNYGIICYLFFFFLVFLIKNQSYHTKNNGSLNWITITKPSVIKIRPKLINNIKQQTPLTFGQNGFGAAIASTVAPLRLLLRPVFAVLATEYILRGP